MINKIQNTSGLKKSQQDLARQDSESSGVDQEIKEKLKLAIASRMRAKQAQKQQQSTESGQLEQLEELTEEMTESDMASVINNDYAKENLNEPSLYSNNSNEMYRTQKTKNEN